MARQPNHFGTPGRVTGRRSKRTHRHAAGRQILQQMHQVRVVRAQQGAAAIAQGIQLAGNVSPPS